MPRSRQQPLTAPHGGYEHDFGLPLADWETACFDRASYFAVIRMRARDDPGFRAEFRFLSWALRYARRRGNVCVYAVAASGRFALLDPDVWDLWEQRWWKSREENDER